MTDGDEYALKDVIMMSMVCVDRVLMERGQEDVALMAFRVHTKLGPSPTQNTALTRSNPASSRWPAIDKKMHMRWVDPYKDEGVWAIIDDGCNSGCHG